MQTVYQHVDRPAIVSLDANVPQSQIIDEIVNMFVEKQLREAQRLVDVPEKVYICGHDRCCS